MSGTAKEEAEALVTAQPTSSTLLSSTTTTPTTVATTPDITTSSTTTPTTTPTTQTTTPTTSDDFTSTTPSNTTAGRVQQTEESGGMGTGGIAGIAVACSLILVLLVVFAVFMARRYRGKKKKKPRQIPKLPSAVDLEKRPSGSSENRSLVGSAGYMPMGGIDNTAMYNPSGDPDHLDQSYEAPLPTAEQLYENTELKPSVDDKPYENTQPGKKVHYVNTGNPNQVQEAYYAGSVGNHPAKRVSSMPLHAAPPVPKTPEDEYVNPDSNRGVPIRMDSADYVYVEPETLPSVRTPKPSPKPAQKRSTDETVTSPSVSEDRVYMDPDDGSQSKLPCAHKGATGPDYYNMVGQKKGQPFGKEIGNVEKKKGAGSKGSKAKIDERKYANVSNADNIYENKEF